MESVWSAFLWFLLVGGALTFVCETVIPFCRSLVHRKKTVTAEDAARWNQEKANAAEKLQQDALEYDPSFMVNQFTLLTSDAGESV